MGDHLACGCQLDLVQRPAVADLDAVLLEALAQLLLDLDDLAVDYREGGLIYCGLGGQRKPRVWTISPSMTARAAFLMASGALSTATWHSL